MVIMAFSGHTWVTGSNVFGQYISSVNSDKSAIKSCTFPSTTTRLRNWKIASQAPKKKHLPSSTRKRNSQRLDQWKAKMNQAVVSLNAEAHVQQTISTTRETGLICKAKQKRTWATQSRSDISGSSVKVKTYQVLQRAPEVLEASYYST